MKLFYKILFLTSIFFFGILADAATLQTSIEGDKNVEVGKEIGATIYIDSDISVNALEFEVEFDSTHLRFSKSDNRGSIVTLWQDKPEESTIGKVILSGGMLAPFVGKNGRVITLYFEGIATGTFNIRISKANIYAADGKATLFIGSKDILVGQVLSPKETIEDVKSGEEFVSEVLDTTPPELSFSIVKSPIEDIHLASFNAIDPESGVKKTEMRYKKWFTYSSWQEARNPERLMNGFWAVQVKAINNDNLETIKTLSFPRILLLRLLPGIVAVIVLVIYMVYNRSKRTNVA